MKEHFSIESTASMEELVEKMVVMGVGSQMVMQGDSIVGVVTERDYLYKVACLREPATSTTEIMTPLLELNRIKSDDLVKNAMKAMAENSVRHLPVEDGRGNLVGLLSIRDILAAITDAMETTMPNPGELNINVPSRMHYVSRSNSREPAK